MNSHSLACVLVSAASGLVRKALATGTKYLPVTRLAGTSRLHAVYSCVNAASSESQAMDRNHLLKKSTLSLNQAPSERCEVEPAVVGRESH